MREYVVIYRDSEGNRRRYSLMALNQAEACELAEQWADEQRYPVSILRVEEA